MTAFFAVAAGVVLGFIFAWLVWIRSFGAEMGKRAFADDNIARLMGALRAFSQVQHRLTEHRDEDLLDWVEVKRAELEEAIGAQVGQHTEDAGDV